jgi:hypothetical protein
MVLGAWAGKRKPIRAMWIIFIKFPT